MAKKIKLKVSFNKYCSMMYNTYIKNLIEKGVKDSPFTYNAYYLEMKEPLKQGYKALVKEARKDKLI